MATYYNSSNQRDVMQTIYLMEPGPVPYPESSSLPNHMVYLNYSSGGSYSDNIAGNSQSHQNCVDLPVLNTMLSQDSSQGPSTSTQSHQGILSNMGYGLWRDGRNELLFMQPATNMQAMGSEMNHRTDPQIGTLHGGKNISAVQGQGLSLSLGTQIPSAIPLPSFQCRPGTMDISFMGSQQSASGDRENHGSRNIKARNPEYPHSCSDQGTNGDLLNNLQSLAALKQMTSDPNSYGLMGHSGTTLNSRYLLAAQKLLDEVVNVRKAVKHETEKHQNFISVAMAGPNKTDGGSKGGSFLPSSSGMGSNPQEVPSNSTSDLSPAERQDLQNKLIKFVSMLEEVDRRYKQYYHQMHIVVSSFDVIGGTGAAKPYTALALHTISRQFRCLRDAISSQIHVARKSLGEQDDSNSKGSGGIPRLRLVDQQLRQQRALQQIGMVQHHSWRPQRGLPESSVSILRAWLFEHFLHPYPKDSDKIMLARQAGLTRSQVSNWFINARVRLWKPMVEEMYKEEIGDAEIDSTTFSENASKAREETGASEDREDLQSMISSTPERSQSASYFTDMKSNQVLGVELSATTIGFHHDGTDKDCTYGNMKPREERPNAEDCHIVQDALVQPGGSRRFMAYHMAELSEFGNRNVSLNDFGNRDVSLSNFGNRDVSLTLGLQHCDAIPVSSGQQTYVTVRGDHIYSTSASVGPTDSGNYDCVDLADRRHRFGSSHLLHDFVA